MEVLEEERAVCTSTLGLVWMRHWYAIAGGVESLLRWSVPVILVGSELSGFGVAIGLAGGALLCRHGCCRVTV